MDERNQEGSTESGNFEQKLAEGQELLRRGSFGDALPLLEATHALDPTHAVARSAYGLCVGLASRDFQRANELCDSAVKQEFFNPDLYLAIARLHLAFGFKSDGLRFLKRGRMIDPGHQGIARELRRLGSRQAPPLRFLPRTHVLNRVLGRAKAQLTRLGPAAAA